MYVLVCLLHNRHIQHTLSPPPPAAPAGCKKLEGEANHWPQQHAGWQGALVQVGLEGAGQKVLPRQLQQRGGGGGVTRRRLKGSRGGGVGGAGLRAPGTVTTGPVAVRQPLLPAEASQAGPNKQVFIGWSALGVAAAGPPPHRPWARREVGEGASRQVHILDVDEPSRIGCSQGRQGGGGAGCR